MTVPSTIDAAGWLGKCHEKYYLRRRSARSVRRPVGAPGRLVGVVGRRRPRALINWADLTAGTALPNKWRPATASLSA